ncbi:MAG: leucyl aminopeptidase [Candidatus Andersenbacteria bacterium]
MQIPQLTLTPLKKTTSVDGLVALVFTDDLARPQLGLPKAAFAVAQPSIADLPGFLKKRGFSAATSDALYCPAQQNRILILIGLGVRKDFSLERARVAAATSLHLLEKLRIDEAALTWPEKLPAVATPADLVGGLVEGVLLGGYEFDRYKHVQSKFSTKRLHLVPLTISKSISAAFQEKQLIAAAVNEARDLQNDNSDEVTPATLAKHAQALAREYKLRCTVLEAPQLKKLGLNLLHAVGRASNWPPKLIVLEYQGNRASNERLALIGKGITFDTGGVNLKPTHGMLTEMHLDMSGAATVLTVLKLAAQLKLKTNLVAVVPVAENAIGGNAYKPGSVLKAYNGQTVEIGNTDAEGRLILADANAYAVKNVHPSAIIDVATLSGVTLVTFGEHYAGLVSNHDQLAEQLYAASVRTAEWTWPLPLVDFYRQQNKSSKADLVNVAPGKRMYGDTIQAGAFLESFCGEVPMAFLDIAGTSMRTRSSGYQPAGGTGFGVRLLIDYLKRNPKGPRAAGAGSRGLGRYASVDGAVVR